MKSGSLAAEAAFEAVAGGSAGRDGLSAMPESLNKSWVAKELKMVRNAQPAIAKFGGNLGTLYSGFDLWLHQIGLGVPWTFGHTPDHKHISRKDQVRPIEYPKPDGKITFDRLSSVLDRKSTRLNSSH